MITLRYDCLEILFLERELTSKVIKDSLRMSSSSRLSAIPKKLVLLTAVIGLSAKLKVFNSGRVCVISGTTVRSLALRSK